MQSKNVFTKYILLGVLMAGQVGCAPDKKQESAASAEPWGLSGIRYLRRGEVQGDIKESKSYGNYFLDDRILFSEGTRGADVLITTRCHWGMKNLKLHARNEVLQKEYRISELIPAEAYLNFEITPASPLLCRFDFEMRNNQKDTHVFSLAELPVVMESEAVLQIKDGKNPVVAGDDGVVLHEKNWADYSVDNPGKKVLMFACEFISAEISSDLDPIPFRDFQFKDIPGEIKSAALTRPTQKCRIIEISPADRRKVLGISREFIVRADVGQPDIRRLLADKNVVRIVDNFKYQAYEISNSTTEPIHLSVPKSFPQVLEAEIVSLYKNRYYTSPTKISLNTAFTGARESETEWRLTLPPYASTKLTVGRARPGFKCAKGYIPVGVFFHLKDLNSLVLHQLYDISKPTDRLNVLNEMPLENTAKTKFANFLVKLPVARSGKFYDPPKSTASRPGACTLR